MNVIRIYTVEGCYACKVLEDTLRKALKDIVEDNFKVEVIDYMAYGHSPILKDNNITDFPTILFMKDRTTLGIHTGTMPKYKILEYIRSYYKLSN
jgi:hypothetical protein